MTKRIAILGSTGSIGLNALKVVSALKGRFEIVGLAADSNIELLSQQAKSFHPRIISVGNKSLAEKIKRNISLKTKVLFGIDGLKEIVSKADVDTVLFAISGSSCLIPLKDAIENKKRIALANKEALVSAGSILMKLAKKNNVKIVPIDSEHSAIFQCLEGKERFLHKIYLTGSGGPLLDVPKNRFDSLPRKYILKHPKWRMGEKISVDSATMMNKGLEIIEAKHLFNIDESAIEILIHPEAIIHSMIELVDGAVFGQLGIPDMRLPIQYALTYPGRFTNMLKRLDLLEVKTLSFCKPDLGRFPCLGLGRTAARSGKTYPAALSASDEVAVNHYLNYKIKFSDIPKVIEKVLEQHRPIKEPTIEDILDVEKWAREEAEAQCSR